MILDEALSFTELMQGREPRSGNVDLLPGWPGVPVLQPELLQLT